MSHCVRRQTSLSICTCLGTHTHTHIHESRQHNSCSVDVMVATCIHPIILLGKDRMVPIVCAHIPLSLTAWSQPAMKTVNICAQLNFSSISAAWHIPSWTKLSLFTSIKITLLLTLSQQEITELSVLRKKSNKAKASVKRLCTERLVSAEETTKFF